MELTLHTSKIVRLWKSVSDKHQTQISSISNGIQVLYSWLEVVFPFLEGGWNRWFNTLWNWVFQPSIHKIPSWIVKLHCNYGQRHNAKDKTTDRLYVYFFLAIWSEWSRVLKMGQYPLTLSLNASQNVYYLPYRVKATVEIPLFCSYVVLRREDR